MNRSSSKRDQDTGNAGRGRRIFVINNSMPEDSQDTYFGTRNILVSEHLQHLVRRGHACSVLGLKALNRPSRWTHRWLKDGDIPVVETVFWRKLEKRGLSVSISAILAAIVAKRQIHRFAADLPILAHNTLWAGVVAYHSKKLFGIPYVLVEHFSWFATGEISPRHKKLAKHVILSADRVYAVSENLKGSLVRFVGKPTFQCGVLPNVVDPSIFKLATDRPSDKERFRLVCISSLKEKKQVHLAIETVAKLASEGVSTKLTIVGTGPKRKILENLASDLGVARRVRFTGYLDKLGVAQMLQDAHALVVPSRYETFCVPVIEAHATGIPVASTPCGGAEELIDDSNGVIAKSSSFSDLFIAVQYLIRNYNSFNSESIRTQALAKYSIRNVLPKLIAENFTG